MNFNRLSLALALLVAAGTAVLFVVLAVMQVYGI
jgi:ABC-type lipoprotein release transport system permease subunit